MVGCQCLQLQIYHVLVWNPKLVLSPWEGQYMAARLSKAITRETKKLRLLQSEYNSTVPLPENVAWDDICSPTLELWLRPEPMVPHPAIPQSIRMQVIKAVTLKTRAREEVQLLKEEMWPSLDTPPLRRKCSLYGTRPNMSTIVSGMISCLCCISYLLYQADLHAKSQAQASLRFREREALTIAWAYERSKNTEKYTAAYIVVISMGVFSP